MDRALQSSQSSQSSKITHKKRRLNSTQLETSSISPSVIDGFLSLKCWASKSLTYSREELVKMDEIAEKEMNEIKWTI